MATNTLAKTYDPKAVEAKWYEFWERRGYFEANVEPGRSRYCITIPPPNVTGELHMGHALQHTIHDTLVRWKRMQGHNTLCLPGTDHAGIATQMKVEQELFEEGLTRYDLGREKLLERVWAWREKYGRKILQQFRALGCSYDWRRERFTLDDGYVRAVLQTFVHFHEKGWIYRGHRMVNWCPQCLTVISDLEVEERETQGYLWHIRYPGLNGGPDVVVATTRPETMLGDTGVAVHPDDERWREAVGQKVLLPLMNRPIPIVADEYADPGMGSGAVKVTPAHDPNDYEVGQRHGLPEMVVIGEDGRMTQAAGRFAGQDRYECRSNVLAALQQQGWLVKVEDYQHAVPHHDKCGTVIEPLVKEQWFVAMNDLAQQAIPFIDRREVRYVPDRFRDYSLEWLRHIRDWCISRQLWWGHRLPVWYCRRCNEVVCEECGRPRLEIHVPATLDLEALTEAEILERSRTEPCLHATYVVSIEPPAACPDCGGADFEQDSDVLDTWFSSALWPFAVLGWPEKTADLAYFHPTDLLITGRDILYLWVARMIMTSLEFLQEVPFYDVFVHPTIMTKDGRRMSKSLGTGIDPLELIEMYGTDATRFSLLYQCGSTQDIRFDADIRDNKVQKSDTAEVCRNFCNKVWNATRFVLMNLEDGEWRREKGKGRIQFPISNFQFPISDLADRWILSRYQAAVAAVTAALEGYRFDEAARTLYEFIWSEYCDWYVEMVKSRLSSEDESVRNTARAVLVRVHEGWLRLLHPFMPFITEELWQQLPHEGESVMIAPWPTADAAWRDEAAEAQMALIMDTVRALRNLRAEANVEPGRRVEAILQAGSEETRQVLEENAHYIHLLARLGGWQLGLRTEEKPRQALSATLSEVDVYLPLKDLVDLDQEVARLQKEIANLEAELVRSGKKLANRDFLAKAPAEVVDREREKRREMLERKERLTERLKALSEATA